MSTATYPDEPTEFLTALSSIMPAGTTVDPANVYVERGLRELDGGWPCLILQCPETEHAVEAITLVYRATFHVQCHYLDRWESSTRSFEQLLADAKTACYQMLRNVRAQPTLDYVGTEATPSARVRVAAPVEVEGLGFPVVVGQIELDIRGPMFR